MGAKLLKCEPIEGEEWRQAVGHRGYEVSSLGRVRSWLVNGHPHATRKEPRIVRQSIRNRYWSVNIGVGKRRNRTVHQLVLEAFVGPRPCHTFDGCHNNGNRDDNRAVNLRWDSRSANQKDAISHGTHNPPIGSRNGMAVLSDEDVRLIKAAFVRLKDELAATYGVTRECINSVFVGARWRHVA